MNLQDTVIKGEEIVIDDSKSFNAIGSGVVLEKCTIRCSVPAQSLSIRGKLVGSLVIAESHLTGFSWLEAKLNSCTFQGVFKENEFGTLSGSNGSCESCDFSEADLEDCSFFGTSSESLTFPKWPYFVILNPHRHLAEMQDRPKHDRIADVVDSIEFLDEEASAITYNSGSLAQRLGLSIGEVQSFFSQFAFVQM
ncbi:hypothetical protein Enr10x_04670 [Gimesia panareensis]|uniref:Uncharacterized protein n=1 Tax=Gimesia panareensis TaxID=2527978 RepID=A0A517Q0P6_9PLAN|nr:hypothetical protein [Gimesia panareensis]QDT25172.1 hypothetical protein Enr10x_04670 [Gimesia panareensis]